MLNIFSFELANVNISEQKNNCNDTQSTVSSKMQNKAKQTKHEKIELHFYA